MAISKTSKVFDHNSASISVATMMATEPPQGPTLQWLWKVEHCPCIGKDSSIGGVRKGKWKSTSDIGAAVVVDDGVLTRCSSGGAHFRTRSATTRLFWYRRREAMVRIGCCFCVSQITEDPLPRVCYGETGAHETMDGDLARSALLIAELEQEVEKLTLRKAKAISALR
jgi:hypothetical protein